MKTNKLQILLVFAILLFSCSKAKNLPYQLNSKDNKTTLQPGVVISFDDNDVNNWIEVSNVLNTYQWKATFFLSNFLTLSENEIIKLKTLNKQGHEIAGHGFHHINSLDYIDQNGMSNYMNTEIHPMINIMERNNLPISSFAYPYGSRNSSVDSLLFNEFKMLRGTTYGSPRPKKADCYFENNRLVYGLGLDRNYAHYSIEYFISLLTYAKKHNKIVIFYAHNPVAKSENNYQVEYETLIQICDFVKKNNMKFYTISELYDL